MNVRSWFRAKPNRFLTIKVITDTGATTRNLVVSTRLVRWAKVASALVLVVLVAGVYAIVHSYYAHRTIRRLTAQTEELHHQTMQIAELREELSEIWVINDRLQHMLGAETTPADHRPTAGPLPWGVPLARWAGRPFILKHTDDLKDGVYFYANPGTLVMATADGTVSDIRWTPSLGDVLIIDNGDGITTRFAHDMTFFVEAGEHVAQGQPIGEIRPTDGTRRPSLFYQVSVDGQSVNPLVAMATAVPGQERFRYANRSGLGDSQERSP